MKTTFCIRLVILIVVAAMLCGCSDLNKDLQVAPTSISASVHADGFTTVTSPDFHGQLLKGQNWDLTGCRKCHGGAFDGGTSGKSCYTCHSKYPHDAKFEAAGGHSLYLRANNYPLIQCQTCHGSTYTGGTITNISCSGSGCHVDASGNPKSPESCNTCHGTFSAAGNDTLSWAPPASLTGDTASSARGVGAHQVHLRGTGKYSTSQIACVGCHVVPTSVYTSGHFDTPQPAEVIITASLAKVTSGGLIPSPTYDSQTLHCSDTYCHGNWRVRKSSSSYSWVFTDSVISGNNYAVQWNGGSAEAACGTTCHANPPKGHVNFGSTTSCTQCHYKNVSNEAWVKSTHINGKINLYGSEYSFK
jgi:hypothetical protein